MLTKISKLYHIPLNIINNLTKKLNKTYSEVSISTFASTKGIKHQLLTKKNLYHMTIIQKQIPFLKKNSPKRKINSAPLQNLFDHLNIIKELPKEEIKSNLSKTIQQIEACPISHTQRASAIKYLMSILYRKQLSDQYLLKNELLKKLYKDQQFVELETFIYVISRQMSKEKPNLQAVNNLYLESFERIVKNMPVGYQKIKCQVLLFKNFGKYLVQNGYYQKGIKMLENCAYLHKQLIVQQYQKTQSFIKKCNEQSKNAQIQKTNQQKQQEKLQINAMRQNIRRLIESMFQTINYFYLVKKNFLKSEKSTGKQKQQAMLQICVMISQCMKVKSFMPGLQLYSRNYHKLMQIYYQLEYSYALLKNNVPRVKQLRQRMREFIKLCMDDLQQTSDQIEVQREITLAVLSIQLHISKVEKGQDSQDLKKDITQCGIKILQKGKIKEKSIQKQILTKLLSQFIKKNIK